MKKLFILIFVCFIYILNYNYDDIDIPDEAIRFRIIANDNSDLSQKQKFILNLKINNYLNNLIDNKYTYNDVNKIISDNIDEFKKITLQFMIENNINSSFDINFGKNYFPSKYYKGINYNEGYYDSLVITLGNGLGNNWWCVLFPPLCNLEAESVNDIEYKFYVNELINNVYNRNNY